MILHLKRQTTSDQGTFGVLLGLTQPVLTLELPWRNNERNVSCIPPGRYPLVPYFSKKHKACYLLEDVPGRSAILIHTGNLAGDPDKGLATNSEGCILPGIGVGTMRNQLAVTGSESAMTMIRHELGSQQHEIIVEDCTE